ncbi:porin family protein [Flavobacterium salilacus subsp. salilacus]|uniref:outer membrane beta-barrel protein n=1 Tax=Flavobacterium TaxID=237 RepID=UPI0010754776|nr:MULTISPECIES: outer membrane beta-barrel protein [Flavobacterium]KAF2518521.1 porin family protein [Flavobacterium salilacus subsp. salilacus]MBE1615163.1 porin family protein [Flavobacterium sp. SaA2.13]
MKKLLLSAAAVFAFAYANAQEETTSTGGFSTGDVFISGSVGFGSEKTGDFKATEFNFSPRAGYFVSDNIALGLALGYNNTKQDEEFGFGTAEVTTNTFEIGAFGRYYFMPASQFSLFTQLGVNYGTTKSEIDNEEFNKANGFNVEFAPGISYFISEHFALEATFGVLSYTTVEPDEDDADSTNTFQLGLNMSDINFGLIYKF